MATRSTTILEKSIRYEPHFLVDHEVPVVWDRAKDCFVWDIDGKKYIDFTSGIFVANVGHAHPKVIKAIKNQFKCIHSYIFPTQVREELVGRLSYLTGRDKVLLTVTGSEANEVAAQIMVRRNVNKIKEIQYNMILAINGAYYGSTSGMRHLDDCLKEDLMPGSFNPKYIAGLFLQAFRGRDARFMPYEWVQDWVYWAQERGIPVAWDEMQSGFGRTGMMWGYQHYDIKPDLICMGKAMGGGLPISAVAMTNELAEYSDDLWSTHTGNPVCCAASLANLDVIMNEHLIDRATEIGKIINYELLEYKRLNGRGAIWAIDLKDKELAENVVTKCAEKGLLLVQTHAGTIKIAPPLTIKEKVLREGLKCLKSVMLELSAKTSISNYFTTKGWVLKLHKIL